MQHKSNESNKSPTRSDLGNTKAFNFLQTKIANAVQKTVTDHKDRQKMKADLIPLELHKLLYKNNCVKMRKQDDDILAIDSITEDLMKNKI